MLYRKLLALSLLQITWGQGDRNIDYEIITFNGQNITVSFNKNMYGLQKITSLRMIFSEIFKGNF